MSNKFSYYLTPLAEQDLAFPRQNFEADIAVTVSRLSVYQLIHSSDASHLYGDFLAFLGVTYYVAQMLSVVLAEAQGAFLYQIVTVAQYTGYVVFVQDVLVQIDVHLLHLRSHVAYEIARFRKRYDFRHSECVVG